MQFALHAVNVFMLAGIFVSPPALLFTRYVDANRRPALVSMSTSAAHGGGPEAQQAPART
jgi:hypothetical protein